MSARSTVIRFCLITLLPVPAHAACLPLRVMSTNIRLDLASDGPNRWSERRR